MSASPGVKSCEISITSTKNTLPIAIVVPPKHSSSRCSAQYRWMASSRSGGVCVHKRVHVRDGVRPREVCVQALAHAMDVRKGVWMREGLNHGSRWENDIALGADSASVGSVSCWAIR